MYNQFKQILALLETDGMPSVSELLNKVFEEGGELAQAVNKLTGRKKVKDGEDVMAHILEEGADTIQCVLAVLGRLGFDYDTIVAEIERKNTRWAESQFEGSPEILRQILAKPNPNCPCCKCNPDAWWMIVCRTCGDKRCPKAHDHNNNCSRFNTAQFTPKP